MSNIYFKTCWYSQMLDVDENDEKQRYTTSNDK